MADIDKVVQFVIKWESGVVATPGETSKQTFERARRRGWANDPLDKGGATQTGLTLNAYKVWCKQHNITTPTIDNLKNIPYETWRAIMKQNYWDKVGGDKITSQSIANIIFDFAWASGSVTASKKVQALLGVKVDGIIGVKTIAAINSKSPLPLFAQIRQERIRYCNAIVRNNPNQAKWLKGWLNRINDIKYSE